MAAAIAAADDPETLTVHLGSGTYAGGVSAINAVAGRRLRLCGRADSGATVLASATAAADVVFLKNFAAVCVERVTLRGGAYGLHLQDCGAVRVANCAFRHCGSDGDAAMHGGAATPAQQAAYKWDSGDASASHTSDGGALNVLGCVDVDVSDNAVSHCFRGLRLQDCLRGRVQGNRVFRTLDNGVYLAAGSGTGADGCEGVVVATNAVEEAGHHGLACVGGKGNVFRDNVVTASWAAGFGGRHLCNCDVVGNHFVGNNWKAHSGYAAAGENYAQVYVAGHDGIDQTAAATHLVTVADNHFVRCGDGHVGSSRLLSVSAAALTANYPEAARRIVFGGNRFDCTGVVLDLNDWAGAVTPLSGRIEPAYAAGDVGGAGGAYDIGTAARRVRAVHGDLAGTVVGTETVADGATVLATTLHTSVNGATACVLPAGVEGQLKILTKSSDAQAASCAVQDAQGAAVVTLDCAGHWCMLAYVGGTWTVAINSGCAAAGGGESGVAFPAELTEMLNALAGAGDYVNLYTYMQNDGQGFHGAVLGTAYRAVARQTFADPAAPVFGVPVLAAVPVFTSAQFNALARDGGDGAVTAAYLQTAFPLLPAAYADPAAAADDTAALYAHYLWLVLCLMETTADAATTVTDYASFGALVVSSGDGPTTYAKLMDYVGNFVAPRAPAEPLAGLAKWLELTDPAGGSIDLSALVVASPSGDAPYVPVRITLPPVPGSAEQEMFVSLMVSPLSSHAPIQYMLDLPSSMPNGGISYFDWLVHATAIVAAVPAGCFLVRFLLAQGYPASAPADDAFHFVPMSAVYRASDSGSAATADGVADFSTFAALMAETPEMAGMDWAQVTDPATDGASMFPHLFAAFVYHAMIFAGTHAETDSAVPVDPGNPGGDTYIGVTPSAIMALIADGAQPALQAELDALALADGGGVVTRNSFVDSQVVRAYLAGRAACDLRAAPRVVASCAVSVGKVVQDQTYLVTWYVVPGYAEFDPFMQVVDPATDRPSAYGIRLYIAMLLYADSGVFSAATNAQDLDNILQSTSALRTAFVGLMYNAGVAPPAAVTDLFGAEPPADTGAAADAQTLAQDLMAPMGLSTDPTQVYAALLFNRIYLAGAYDVGADVQFLNGDGSNPALHVANAIEAFFTIHLA